MSIDGGGTRGIIPAILLASIEERTRRPICELFDMIAGTSTGAIIALALAKPSPSGAPEFSARELCRAYEKEIPVIFQNPQSWWGNLLGPKYSSSSFREVLNSNFRDCRLKSALVDVLVPCYDIEHREPYIFKSRMAREDSDHDFFMSDVALAASASPTLFYPLRIPRTSRTSSICLVDGGVFANNPTALAFSEIRAQLPDNEGECCIVSLGTGRSKRPLTDEFISLWGYVQWSRPMLELVMESISESVHEQMQSLLLLSKKHSYHRLQVPVSADIDFAIDNASEENMDAFKRVANEYCKNSDSSSRLTRLCDTLLRLTDEIEGMREIGSS